MADDGKMTIVTEIGNFGDLAIKDPTTTEVCEESMDEMIAEAIKNNANLSI